MLRRVGAPKGMKVFRFPVRPFTAEALSALRWRGETISYFRSSGSWAVGAPKDMKMVHAT